MPDAIFNPNQGLPGLEPWVDPHSALTVTGVGHGNTPTGRSIAYLSTASPREWAILVGAVAVLLLFAAIAFSLVTRRKGDQLRAHLDTKLGSLELSVEQVSKAVNHVQDGEPTLIDRVRLMEAHQAWEAEVLALVLRHLGIDRIPPRPPTMRSNTTRTRKDDQ